ncbi:MAG: rhamnulokinase, partial [Planctomycetales bacterium]|nr:rhamnulokinase [Planctomycetales bacterium]
SELTRMAEEAPAGGPQIDPNDARLVAPVSMPDALAELCREANLPAPTTPGATIRCALESLAASYRVVLERLEKLAGRSLEAIHVVGGGVQNELLCQMTADACKRPVLAGPIEATALGNVMMQALADGQVSDVAQAREAISASFEPKRYDPRQ